MLILRYLTAPLLVGGLVFGGVAFAQEGPAAKPVTKIKRVAKAKHPAAFSSPASGGLNAPSTDFSNVSPQIDDPKAVHDRAYNGPRPSINENGTPGMNIGF